MNTYSVFRNDGLLDRLLSVSADMLDYNVMEGETAIEGIFASHYLKDGIPTELPPQPAEYYIFDAAAECWVDSRSLEQAKAARWAAIKLQRTVEEFAPFEYNGMIFDGDIDAQRRLSHYISVAKSNPQLQAAFTLANNSEVMLSAADFIAIEAAKVAQVAAVFAKGVQLRNQIESATDLASVDAIVW
jgi:hypothetical protein